MKITQIKDGLSEIKEGLFAATICLTGICGTMYYLYEVARPASASEPDTPAWIESDSRIFTIGEEKLFNEPLYMIKAEAGRPKTRAEYLEEQKKRREKLAKDRKAAQEKARAGRAVRPTKPTVRPTKPTVRPTKPTVKAPPTRPPTYTDINDVPPSERDKVRRVNEMIEDKQTTDKLAKPVSLGSTGLMFKFKIDVEWGIGWGNIKGGNKKEIGGLDRELDQQLFKRTNELYREYLEEQERKLNK